MKKKGRRKEGEEKEEERKKEGEEKEGERKRGRRKEGEEKGGEENKVAYLTTFVSETTPMSMHVPRKNVLMFVFGIPPAP